MISPPGRIAGAYVRPLLTAMLCIGRALLQLAISDGYHKIATEWTAMTRRLCDYASQVRGMIQNSCVQWRTCHCDRVRVYLCTEYCIEHVVGIHYDVLRCTVQCAKLNFMKEVVQLATTG